MRITEVGRARAPLARGAVLAARGAVLAACGAALAGSVVLTACGSGGSHGSGAATAGQSGDNTVALARCYRTHGDPSFPDPTYDPSDGKWHFAVSPGTVPAATRQACQHLFPSVNPSPPVPQAQFQQLLRLAECLRQHGVPNWPDPDPDGGFGLPPALQTKTPAYARAAQACQRLMPSGGPDEYAAS
jgi:hypothetical protein